MKSFSRKAATTIFSLAAITMIAACGSDEKSPETDKVSSSVNSSPVNVSTEVAPVPMYEAALDTTGVILGEDNYYHCAEGLREIEIPAYREGVDINGTTARVTSEFEPGLVPEYTNTITTVRFNGPLPEVVGAYLEETYTTTDDQGNRRSGTNTFASNWLPGMEKALVVDSRNFGARYGFSSLRICIR